MATTHKGFVENVPDVAQVARRVQKIKSWQNVRVLARKPIFHHPLKAFYRVFYLESLL